MTLQSDKREYLKLLEEKLKRQQQNKIATYFPEAGEFSRHAYKKHMEFFKEGTNYRERLFIAANRTGKTVAGAYETTLHLTGNYPEWWEGRRFEHEVSWWVAGDDLKTTRDICQLELLGDFDNIGTGMIPAKYIEGYTKRPGVPDAVESVSVKHISGGVSRLGLKSYDQKRKSFQGTSKHGIWLDEEPDVSIYTECLMRTMTTEGLILLTFTPLLGISDVVKQFLPGGKLTKETDNEKRQNTDIQ